MTAGPLVDARRFDAEVTAPYNAGRGADLAVSQADETALVPPATTMARDLGYVASELPVLDAARCTGCMECVVVCPDAAVEARVVPEIEHVRELVRIEDDALRAAVEARFATTRKFGELPSKRDLQPARFGLLVDPHRCKGCGECADVCDSGALTMRRKGDGGADVSLARAAFEVVQSWPETPAAYVQERIAADWMLTARSLLYCGGAGSCRGCGEATAIRTMLAATGYRYGEASCAVVAATGCNSVFGSTWPHNPFRVPWTNSLFENAPAVSMGLRVRYDQRGWADKKIWVVGGDGALCDIGFGSLSRLLASGLDVNVLVLDTQVYSNTGGQASTATFPAQVAKMASYGGERAGKSEARKELGVLAMLHGDVFVAQTTPAYVPHFYRAIADANAFHGPALVNVYCPCQPEHGIADDASYRQARRAVAGRAFPLFTYDPRRGEALHERLSLQGNPSAERDWHEDPKTKEPFDFVSFARTEGRFARQFDREGAPSDALARARDERLRNWRRLRELARA